MIIKSDVTKEKFIKELAKLNAEEFLGVATILRVSLYQETPAEAAPVSGSVLGQAIEKAKSENIPQATTTDDHAEDTLKAADRQLRPFEMVIADMLANYCALNRTQRRNLFDLVKTATKKR